MNREKEEIQTGEKKEAAYPLWMAFRFRGGNPLAALFNSPTQETHQEISCPLTPHS